MTQKQYKLNIPKSKRQQVADHITKGVRKGIIIDFMMIVAIAICVVRTGFFVIDLMVKYAGFTKTTSAKNLILGVAIAIVCCDTVNLVRNLHRLRMATAYAQNAIDGIRQLDIKKPHDTLKDLIMLFMRANTATDIFMTVIDAPEKITVTNTRYMDEAIHVQYFLDGLTYPVSYAERQDRFFSLMKPNGDTLTY